MLPKNLKITCQEQDLLKKWIEICSDVLGDDESWEDGVLLKGLYRRMKKENYSPIVSDIKQWYIVSLISQDLLEYQNEPHDIEKYKLENLNSKLNDVLNYFFVKDTNEV